MPVSALFSVHTTATGRYRAINGTQRRRHASRLRLPTSSRELRRDPTSVNGVTAPTFTLPHRRSSRSSRQIQQRRPPHRCRLLVMPVSRTTYLPDDNPARSINGYRHRRRLLLSRPSQRKRTPSAHYSSVTPATAQLYRSGTNEEIQPARRRIRRRASRFNTMFADSPRGDNFSAR